MGESNPNVEKFLPAIIGVLSRVGRAAGAAGGGDEEEEKSMDKQQIEKSLLKLMKHYPGDEGYDIDNTQHQRAMSSAINDWDGRDDSRYDSEHDDIISPPYKVSYSDRKGKGLTNLGSITPESDTEFGMGELEQRIANKPRNKPTYPLRDRGTSPESQKERMGQYQSPGRPKPEIGATPSLDRSELSSKTQALKKMMDVFLSKKADPAMAAQNRSATRQRSAATQERIAGQHAAGAQRVEGPVDNTAQQIGSEIAGSVGWAIQDTLRDRGGGQGTSQPREGQPSWAGVDDATSQDDMASAVSRLGEHVGAQGAAFGDGGVDAIKPGTKAPTQLVDVKGQPLSSQSINTPPGTAPSTKPAANNNKLNLTEHWNKS